MKNDKWFGIETMCCVFQFFVFSLILNIIFMHWQFEMSRYILFDVLLLIPQFCCCCFIFMFVSVSPYIDNKIKMKYKTKRFIRMELNRSTNVKIMCRTILFYFMFMFINTVFYQHIYYLQLHIDVIDAQ